MMLILNLCILGVLTWRLVRHFHRRFGFVVIWGLLAKITGATALWLTYTYYYESGDTFELWKHVTSFNESNAVSLREYISSIFAPIDPHQGNPRSIFFTRIISPIGLLTGDSYLWITTYLCLFSFGSTWFFIDRLSGVYPEIKTLIIIVFGFFPTYVFWSSGLLKDTVINGSLLYLIGCLVAYLHTKKLNIIRLVLCAVLFYVLFMTRHYLAGILAILSFAVILDGWLKRYGKVTRTIAILLCLMIGAYSIRYFFIRLRPERFPITFHELHNQFRQKENPGSLIDFNLEPTWSSLLANVPKATIIGIFRPGLWEINNPLQLLEAIFTTLILLLFMLTLINFRRIKSFSTFSIAAILFVLVLATALPLSTPNFGSLSRYRVAFTPILTLLLAYIPYRKYVLKCH